MQLVLLIQLLFTSDTQCCMSSIGSSLHLQCKSYHLVISLVSPKDDFQEKLNPL